MKSINQILWYSGLILQALLLLSLFLRGLARRFPLFSLLILFYIVRVSLLYFLHGHISREAYADLYENSSLADIALQFLVAAEIAVNFFRAGGAFAWPRATWTAAIFLGGVLVATVAAAFIPSHGRVPVDRGSAATALLMVYMFLWSMIGRIAGTARWIAAGFSLYGVTAIIASVARSQAALHRDATAYTTASYVQSGMYLAVLLLWLLILRRPIEKPTRRRARAAA